MEKRIFRQYIVRKRNGILTDINNKHSFNKLIIIDFQVLDNSKETHNEIHVLFVLRK